MASPFNSNNNQNSLVVKKGQKPELHTNWILIGIISAGLILRLYNLGHKCFWEDEGVTWFFGRGIIHEDASPGLYFLLLHLFQLFFGGSEFAGRLLSALAGTLFVFLIFLLCRRMFDQRSALFSAFIVSISPYAISVSQEMRMYALLGVEIALAFYLFWIILEKTLHETVQIKWWIGILVVSVAGLYTHTLFAFVFLFLTVAYFLVCLRSSPRRLIHWVLLMLIISITYVPELINIGARVGVRRHVLVQPTLPALMSNVNQILRSLVTFGFGYYYKVLKTELTEFVNLNFADAPTFLLGVLLILGFIGGIVIFLRRRNSISETHRRGIKFLFYFILYNVVLFLIVESTGAQKLMPLYIPIILLLGLLLSHLNVVWRIGFLALLSILTSFSLANYYSLSYFPYEEANWRQAGQFLSDNMKPEDLVFSGGGRNVLYTLQYYSSNLPPAMLYVNTKHWEPDAYQIDLKKWRNLGPETYMRDLLKRHNRIWYVELNYVPFFYKVYPTVQPDSIYNFGPQLRYYLLTQTSL